MSEENQQDQPQQPNLQQPVPQPAHAEPCGCSGQHSLIKGLVIVFALSFAAALWIIIVGGRGDRKPSVKIDGDDVPAVAAMMKKKTKGLGWITIRGGIYESDSMSPWDKRSSSDISRRILKMGDDKNVKGIVLDINSPGGSVAAVQDIYESILQVREKNKKPVVALFRDVSASGGYYIAAACDKIVAYPGTITGSIGVIFSVTNFQGLMQKVGVNMDAIKSGEHKDIASPYRKMTDEEKKILQALIDDSYRQFLAAVSKGRGIPEDVLRPLADGRIYSGTQALSLKLIDSVGGRKAALEIAGEMSGLGKDPEIIGSQSDRWDQIFSFLDSKFHGGGILSSIDRTPHYTGLEYLWSL